VCVMVPRMRLERIRPCGHRPLKTACLPIPPPGHERGACLWAGTIRTAPSPSSQTRHHDHRCQPPDVPPRRLRSCGSTGVVSTPPRERPPATLAAGAARAVRTKGRVPPAHAIERLHAARSRYSRAAGPRRCVVRSVARDRRAEEPRAHADRVFTRRNFRPTGRSRCPARSDGLIGCDGLDQQTWGFARQSPVRAVHRLV